jgi:RHS repeat-associated protein
MSGARENQMKNDYKAVQRTLLGLAASMLWCVGNVFAQFCPGATSYFASNYSLPSCSVGTCWSATPFSGSTAVTGSTYPSTNYACATATPPAGAQENTLYTYDNNGNLLTARDPLAHQTGSIFDALNRLTQVLDPNLGTSIYAYDAANNLTQVTDPRGNATAYAYDGLNNLAQQLSPDTGTTTNTYDAAGNLLTKTDARGAMATYSYDVLNRVTQVVYSRSATPSETHTFTYDSGTNALGRLSAISDPTGTTSYQYDSHGRVTQKQATIITGAGNKTLTTGYTYNAAGQLTQLTYPSGAALTYGYDGAARVQSLTATLPGGTTTCPQDVSSQIGLSFGPAGSTSQKIVITNTGSTSIQGPINLVVSILPSTVTLANGTGTTDSCNPPVSRAEIQVRASGTPLAPGGSQALVLQFNNPNQSTYTLTTQVLAGVTGSGGGGSSTVTLLSNAGYEPFGPPSGWRWGNGLNMFRDYDLDGRLATWEFRNGVSYLRKDYSFDVASRITGISDPNLAAANRGYQYDVLDRLTVAQSGSPLATSQQFNYDAVGNRLTQTTGAGTTTLTYPTSGNQLQAVSGAQSRTYSYDGAGNPTAISSQTNVYNNANRLAAVQSGASTLASYQVNALGQRVSKTAGSSTTLFAYDQQGHLVGEYDGSVNLVEETVWFGDLPVATLQPQAGQIAAFYVHADHLGSPRVVTRPSDNAIMWQWDNVDPFGVNAANENPSGQGTFRYAMRFPGQYFDAETGTHYNYFRDYDPTIGRYIESDPIGLGGGLNTYGYARQSPASVNDVFGLYFFPPKDPPPDACMGRPPKPPLPLPKPCAEKTTNILDCSICCDFTNGLNPLMYSQCKTECIWRFPDQPFPPRAPQPPSGPKPKGAN